MSKHPIVIRLFTWFWRERLNTEYEERVVAVLGWRMARIDNKFGGRKTVAFCGWWGD